MEESFPRDSSFLHSGRRAQMCQECKCHNSRELQLEVQGRPGTAVALKPANGVGHLGIATMRGG